MSVPFKQLPIIRHIRWLYLSLSFGHWWDKVGRYLGCFPNQADLDYLQRVWEGEE